MRGKAILSLALLLWLIPEGVARADEIRLKDGTKIVGTIVGFENDSFRVETSYGYALVQKDKVADISIVATKKDSEPKSKPGASSTPAAGAPAAVVPAVAKESAVPANVSPQASALAPMHAPVSSGPSASALAKAETPAPAIKSVAAVAPPIAAPAPPPAPAPVVIRDEIRGTQYVNLTFGFQMYK